MTTIIHAITEPLPFLQIENLYSEDELKLIWQELEFLNHPNKLNPPEDTGTAVNNKTKELLKNNKGLFLDEVYTKRNMSNILFLSSKLFLPEILQTFSGLSIGYETITRTNSDKTMISYYENGGYYKPHKDGAIYTAITWFYKEPKLFSGGDFYFTDYDLKIKIQNNMTVLFPSCVTHHVDKVIFNNELPGYGRYAVTQFLYLTHQHILSNK
jgi:hypothetical protein